MKKLLYIIFMSFTLIGCTSNEKDVLDNVQFYTTDDLVEIASEYGIKFQPQKEAVGIHLSQAEMDSFIVKLNGLKGLRGKRIFDRCIKTENEEQSIKYNVQFPTRSKIDSLYDKSYSFETNYYNSYYACDCTVAWSILFDENGEYSKSYASAFVSILNQLDGMSASDEIDSESKDDISFTPWLNAFEFQGSLLVPYKRANLPIGYFTLGYYGCVMISDLDGSFIEWR